MKNRYSILSLFKNALSYHENWQKLGESRTKKEYDAVIIGGGGHGLATAYYLAKKHDMKNIAVVEKDGSVVVTQEGILYYQIKLFVGCKCWTI